MNDGLNTIQFQSLSFNPVNPLNDLLGGTQDNGDVLVHRLADVARERRRRRRPVGLRRRAAVHSLPQLLRRHTRGELPRRRPEGVARRSTTRSRSRRRRARSTCRSRLTRRSAAGRSSGWSTCGAPTTTAATRPTSRRTATRCIATRHLRRLAADRQLADRRLGQRSRRPVRRRRSSGQRPTRGTLWAGTRTGRLWVTKDADSASAGSVHFWRIDTPSTPGRFVLRDRDRPSRPEPRVDLLLGLQRLHAGHAAARDRGALRPEDPQRRRSPIGHTTSATSR